MAIVEDILAFGVLQALARAERERNKASPITPQSSEVPRRDEKQFTALK
jgi:hypothetical protein